MSFSKKLSQVCSFYTLLYFLNSHYLLIILVLLVVVVGISSQDQGWYALLTSKLTPEQSKSLKDILVTADQRKAAKESKQIEKQGGFAFTQQTVPKCFKFGS